MIEKHRRKGRICVIHCCLEVHSIVIIAVILVVMVVISVMLVVVSMLLVVASLIPIIPKQLLLDEMPHLLWIHGRGTVPSLPLTTHE